jgi:hypothetical protein
LPTPGTCQEVRVGLPGGAVSDRAVDVPIEIGKLGLQEIDMPIDGLEDARLTGETAAVFLRHDHLDDLPPPRHEFAQRLGFAVGHAPGGRAYGFGEVGDRASKDARLSTGYGAAASRRSVLASLPVERAKSRI